MDALVALTIIALTVVLGLNAFRQAGRATRLAAEIQAAKILMAQLIDAEPKTYAGTAGSDARFDWSVQTQPTGSNALIDVCRRAVSLVARDGRRRYGMSTLVTCPTAAQS